MISHPAFPAEPWCLRETELQLRLIAQSESLFALSNGHLGWRGNLDEGEPHGLPGSYLNGVYEQRPLPYAETGYGFPESGETIINITNGKLLRLLVDDEPFDVRYGDLRSHERVLDFRSGTLHRAAEWVSPTGRAIRLTSTRLVSLTQRAIAAVSYEVEPVGGPVSLVIQSELIANEQLPSASRSRDPRKAAVLLAPLRGETHVAQGDTAMLIHRTRHSKLRVAAAMRHVVATPAACRQTQESRPDLARLTVTARLEPGQSLRLVKFVGYGWSDTRSLPALRDQVDGALTTAIHAGWDGLLAQQSEYLAGFWDRADVELDGDPEVQQAIRFGLFHVLQATARAEGQAIAAKGLTGPGYDGHAFWDTEMFVSPLLTCTNPEAAASTLRWRHTTLHQAKARARQLGLGGAAFPWRTISGAECSGYWPAGTAAFHVNAAVADAVTSYVRTTGDTAFEAEAGLELLVQTARLWRSIGHFDDQGKFRIDGVTGPDEYSALADNNLYTNLMAQQNLRSAADAAERHPDEARALAADEGELLAWRAAASAMTIPFDSHLGVHQQAEGFTRHEVWDFNGTSKSQYPLMRHFHYFDLYRKQVVKQADLILAMHRHPEAFTAEQKARNFAYYERLTVRDSSLSAITQSVLAAETGQLELAHDYLAETALIDLADTEHNVRDGLHLAALAGTWTAVVAGLGGMRRRQGVLTFHPWLPATITRICFTISERGQQLRAEIVPAAATYLLAGGPPVPIAHHGQLVTLQAGQPQVLPVPACPDVSPLTQPRGRTPARRAARPR